MMSSFRFVLCISAVAVAGVAGHLAIVKYMAPSTAYAKGDQERGGSGGAGGKGIQFIPGGFCNICEDDDKGSGADNGGDPDTNHGNNGPGDSNPW